MSLHLAAQHLAAQGRGPDTTLVHMAPNEVHALQGLARAAGGSLTTNPHTGLPEAGFLSALLPVLGGIAGSFAGIPPWLTMAAIGGGTGLASGSLSKGLMAGMGAYGGMNMAGSFGAMGAGTGTAADTAAKTVASQTPTVAANAGTEAAKAAVNPTIASASAAAAPASLAAPVAPTGSMFGLSKAAAVPAYDTGNLASYGLNSPISSSTAWDTGKIPTLANVAAPSSAAAAQTANEAAYSAMSPMDKMSAMGRGFTMDNVGKWASLNKPAAVGIAAPLIMELAKPPSAPKAVVDSDPGTRYAYEKGAATPVPAASPTGIEQGYFPNARYRAMAGGGLSSAESHLGDYSDGGRLLRGPGDGVSDSIPATIGGRQPARLADGEFVVPARIVSELGNGSTEAGAKQLYAMMERIQHARRKTTGAKQIAAKTNAMKMLPV